MNILYVYAHPNSVSFNHLLKDVGVECLRKNTHHIILSDLYAEKFNPIADWNDFHLPTTETHQQYFAAQKIAYEKQALSEDITKEMEKISQADHIIFQFPLWWFSVPAILKGWLDRVLVKGFAYDAGKIFNDGLLKGKTASLVVTTQSPETAYQLDGAQGYTIDVFLYPIHHTLKFVGIKPLKSFVVYGAFDINNKRQTDIISHYQQYLTNLIK